MARYIKLHCKKLSKFSFQKINSKLETRDKSSWSVYLQYCHFAKQHHEFCAKAKIYFQDTSLPDSKSKLKNDRSDRFLKVIS